MLYLVDSIQKDENSLIREFHRKEDGTHEVKTINTFKPYFYVDEGCPLEQFEGVVRTEKGFTSIEKTPLKKVIMQKSTLVKDTRTKAEGMGFNTWEADILFHNRYCIDMPQDIAPGNIKVCWFDIETSSEDENDTAFPDIETANQVICSIASMIDGKMETWLCGKNSLEGVRYFPKETDMLNDFLNYFHRESPDILSAWNLDNFDLPYLINRCDRLRLDTKRLSKVYEVYKKTFKGEVEHKIGGLINFDLLTAYRLWRKYGNMPQLPSYSLNAVAKTVLNDQKIQHGKSIGWLWRHDVKLLVEYNQHDVELLEQIDKRCKVVDFFDEIRRKCRIQFNDVYKTTAMVDGFLLTRLNKKVILPTTKRNPNEDFDGALVIDPVPGIYNNVICADVASMYPSMIKTYNISYETVDKEGILLPIKFNGEPISFSRDPGIIPMFLDELKEERKGYKKKMDAAETAGDEANRQLFHQRQYGTKVLMNSFFGYLGFEGSRLYKLKVAYAITGMGQYTFTKIGEWVKQYGELHARD